MNERVTIKTSDGVTIVGDYYEGGGDKACLLLHMMPATRASWVSFANTLVADGISALAIDLRGHGESLAGPAGPLDYQKFSDTEHQSSILDVESAIAYLKSKNVIEIDIAGASIGANLALMYASQHPEIRSVISLSCGLSYHGLDTESVADKFTDESRVYFLASSEDEYSTASTKELYERVRGHKKIEVFDGAGHGTTILERKPEYMKILADWLIVKE